MLRAVFVVRLIAKSVKPWTKIIDVISCFVAINAVGAKGQPTLQKRNAKQQIKTRHSRVCLVPLLPALLRLLLRETAAVATAAGAAAVAAAATAAAVAAAAKTNVETQRTRCQNDGKKCPWDHCCWN